MIEEFGTSEAAIDFVLRSLPACCRRDTYTYVLKAGDYVKIGRTTSPAHRLKAIQSCCPQMLTVLAISRGNCERALHAMCDKYRVHGEWFSARCLVVLEPLIENGCLTCLLELRNDARSSH